MKIERGQKTDYDCCHCITKRFPGVNLCRGAGGVGLDSLYCLKTTGTGCNDAEQSEINTTGGQTRGYKKTIIGK